MSILRLTLNPHRIWQKLLFSRFKKWRRQSTCIQCSSLHLKKVSFHSNYNTFRKLLTYCLEFFFVSLCNNFEQLNNTKCSRVFFKLTKQLVDDFIFFFLQIQQMKRKLQTCTWVLPKVTTLCIFLLNNLTNKNIAAKNIINFIGNKWREDTCLCVFIII